MHYLIHQHPIGMITGVLWIWNWSIVSWKWSLNLLNLLHAIYTHVLVPCTRHSPIPRIAYLVSCAYMGIRDFTSRWIELQRNHDIRMKESFLRYLRVQPLWWLPRHWKNSASRCPNYITSTPACTLTEGLHHCFSLTSYFTLQLFLSAVAKLPEYNQACNSHSKITGEFKVTAVLLPTQSPLR